MSASSSVGWRGVDEKEAPEAWALRRVGNGAGAVGERLGAPLNGGRVRRTLSLARAPPFSLASFLFWSMICVQMFLCPAANGESTTARCADACPATLCIVSLTSSCH